jgi:diguanylate cyclase (GGDEF)-like protein
LEGYALASLAESSKDTINFERKVSRGEMPAAGFEANRSGRRANNSDFLLSIASARQEAHTLFELSQDLGNSLSLDETFSLVAMRLRKLVPYDSLVAFVKKGDTLVPEFVNGDNFRLFSSLKIPVGTGLCGWVAQNSIPIINGDPAVEQGMENKSKMASSLRSALAVPLEGITGLVGVLALYQDEPDAFTSDHLRILQVITAKVALFIENALKYRQAESSATIDYLTGMGNARALSLHLEQELARCKRDHESMAVMVCDLNGFKQINDRYGHLAGDKALKMFANMLIAISGERDYAARMGGDEFVIIAPDLSPESVAEKTVLLNTMAQRAGWEVSGKDLLSLSLGAAFYPRDGTDAEQLLADADKKMYISKRDHYQRHEQILHTHTQQPSFATIN